MLSAYGELLKTLVALNRVLGQGISLSVDPLPKGSDPIKIRQIIHNYQLDLETGKIMRSRDSSNVT